MKATKNGYVRQYPRQNKRNDKHNLESQVFDRMGNYRKPQPPATNNGGGRVWTRKHFPPAYNYKPDVKPHVNVSGIVPMGDKSPFDMRDETKDRVKPTSDYTWVTVHERPAPEPLKGKIVIQQNARGEFRFDIGKGTDWEYCSLSVYANQESVKRAIKDAIANLKKGRWIIT